MKFLVTKELAPSTLLRHLIVAVMVALFFYLLLDLVLHHYLFGLTYGTLTSTLYGDMDAFIEPILFDTLLLQVHIDLFMSLFALMIISSVYIRLFSTQSMTKWLVHLLFIGGLLSPIVLVVAYFGSVVWIYVWLAIFIFWHGLGVGMSLHIIKHLVFHDKS